MNSTNPDSNHQPLFSQSPTNPRTNTTSRPSTNDDAQPITNSRAVASSANLGNPKVLRVSDGFSPNPPEFAKGPATEAGKGGKAGGTGGVTFPYTQP